MSDHYPIECAWCAVEAGGAPSPRASHTICARHRGEMLALADEEQREYVELLHEWKAHTKDGLFEAQECEEERPGLVCSLLALAGCALLGALVGASVAVAIAWGALP